MNSPLHDPTMQYSGFFPAVLVIALFFLLSSGCLDNWDESRAWNTKGEAYHDLGRYEEAVSAFDHAITLDPENGEAWRNRGLSLSQLNRSAEAEESYSRALEINADDSEAWYFRALSLSAAGDITGALESTDRAVTIVPKSHDEAILLSESWRLRGELLLKMNRGEEANESYLRAQEAMMSTI
jgi:tetratricopeptide (TPR) repeat protein